MITVSFGFSFILFPGLQNCTLASFCRLRPNNSSCIKASNCVSDTLFGQSGVKAAFRRSHMVGPALSPLCMFLNQSLCQSCLLSTAANDYFYIIALLRVGSDESCMLLVKRQEECDRVDWQIWASGLILLFPVLLIFKWHSREVAWINQFTLLNYHHKKKTGTCLITTSMQGWWNVLSRFCFISVKLSSNVKHIKRKSHWYQLEIMTIHI